MHRRQPLPRLWLMTDERMGDRLWEALQRLPTRSGVVFRHYSVGGDARRMLWEDVRTITRQRQLVLIAAGAPLPGADGFHNRRGWGIRTASAHNLRELRAAERRGANLVFLSPVFATRSHPDVNTLGVERFALIARQAQVPVIALGGMDARKAKLLRRAYGWAAIDAWSA